ncbi:NGG1p interacting factor NIF3 [Rhodocytophaga rosea]|uniref:NGG1p interacting factor NIF3 n=1 Tax=Rhodocytophaga rosea TaxID=2704465 RepID=A0A6C0GQ27_9BACT|nr:Nif3-like dinuclear metal center hexameric protein [Rhodocytophaga rosea]QHT70166.1 NGG1p interacting factor NIF3 [Rhodocytophaga rosea]
MSNHHPFFVPANGQGRREFFTTISKAIGSVMLLPMVSNSVQAYSFPPSQSWTVGQIMDMFIKEVPGGTIDKTVDTLKSGSRDIVVTGIITTMFATLEVIQQAIQAKANFIIAHEPTFYNHLDETDWLAQDEVYTFKADLLKKHNIAIWRNHDYVHTFVPDGVKTGVANQLGWQKQYDIKSSIISLLAPMSLKAIISQVKDKLHISQVRYIGDLSKPCRKILLNPGATMGKGPIQAMMREKPDVLLCGEIHEWEVAEYVRDARTKGGNLSLIIMGHSVSEEPGSEFMAGWLREKLPGMKITHIPSNNPLSFM